MEVLAGWLMIVVSSLVLFAAFPGEYNGALLPEFLGAAGLPFALIYTVVQFAVAARFRKAVVLWLVTAAFAAGALLGTIGHAIDLHGFCAEHGISWAAYVLCGGSCASGLALGIAIVRGWVHDPGSGL